jgi:molybdate transport system regulatory protein
MEVRSKIWLEIDGEPVFGSGRDALLRAIERTGSINKAARELHISYRKALSYIQNMEKRLGTRLVERHAGGRNGGGATLTGEAIGLLQKYEELERGVNDLLDLRFLQIFGSGNGVK